MTGLDYPLYDADNHFYETPDCFSRHIESRYADKAITAERDAQGEWVVKVGGRPYDFMDVKFDKTNPPGSMHAILRQKDVSTDITWGSSYSKEHMLAGFQHRDARLALMDEQGVECAILLPTFGVSVEHCMVDDVEQTYANLRSFNRWLEEEWGFGRDGRIVSPPLLSLLDRDLAVQELDRVLAAGARLVHLRPGPIGNGRSPADPWYDPFWARINEARVPVAFHIADNRYDDVSAAWGEDPDPPVRQMSAFQWAFVHGDRPIMETFGALLYGNIFARFPNLRVLSIENGSDWVHYLLTLLDKKKGMGRFGKWVGGRPAGRPSATFREYCFVSPYPEDDVKALIDRIGASQVLFGSDYPHPEGMAEPARFADLLEGCSDKETRLVMRENTEQLLAGAR
ncbi:MAG TPA: amidohydrolase family protein [Acidimicrobiales bacterium]|nr:amidohydrolase family protein [Acidimicrobiales bacterium]